MTSFEVLLKCHSLTLSKKCLRLRPAPSKCLSERINWIISTIPHRISKILFVYGSFEFPAMLEGKTGEGFLRAALTVHGHPGPVWKIAKMALFDPCMEFEFFLGQMTSFEVLLKCHSLTLSKKCLRLRPALSMCLSERINWIISRIPHRISKILFVYGSYEFLAMLEGKIREAPFF